MSDNEPSEESQTWADLVRDANQLLRDVSSDGSVGSELQEHNRRWSNEREAR